MTLNRKHHTSEIRCSSWNDRRQGYTQVCPMLCAYSVFIRDLCDNACFRELLPDTVVCSHTTLIFISTPVAIVFIILYLARDIELII